MYSVLCAAALTFFAASAARAVMYARRPLHLRWEIYPVPHEEPGRAAHGGSYFEESEWWISPPRFRLVGELRAMAQEILLLKGLREANRPLWYRSYPFHAGLYLMAVAGALVVLLALSRTVGSELPGRATALAAGAAAVAGLSGLVLSLGGAIALLHRRATDPALRAYSARADYFNLAFFILALTLTGVGYLARPAGSPGALAIALGLLSWDETLPVFAPFAAGILCSALLLAYIPFTHMAHFVAKYFTYHAVRWDDAPMRGHPAIAARLAEQLAYRTTWSAPHVAGGEERAWTEVAVSNPTEAKR